MAPTRSRSSGSRVCSRVPALAPGAPSPVPSPGGLAVPVEISAMCHSRRRYPSRYPNPLTRRRVPASAAGVTPREDGPDPGTAVAIDRSANIIGRMANNMGRDGASLGAVGMLVTVYVVGMVATIAALAVLTSTAPTQATDEAWGHAVIVTVLATVLLLRLRSARAGSVGAVRAIGVIAAVLLVVNLVEAALPGVCAGWRRVGMVSIAVLMAALLVLALRSARRARTRQENT